MWLRASLATATLLSAALLGAGGAPLGELERDARQISYSGLDEMEPNGDEDGEEGNSGFSGDDQFTTPCRPASECEINFLSPQYGSYATCIHPDVALCTDDVPCHPRFDRVCPPTRSTAAPTTGAPTPGVVTPTVTPSTLPTHAPSAAPTATPSAAPSPEPSPSPTAAPSTTPTATPSAVPTSAPSSAPTAAPTAWPTARPSASPTPGPTGQPTTTMPTLAAATFSPTSRPTTTEPTPCPSAVPTAAPATSEPTALPTLSPATPTPTAVPSASPTGSAPSAAPATSGPSAAPSPTPTAAPTAAPARAPSRPPIAAPIAAPIAVSSAAPITRMPMASAAPTQCRQRFECSIDLAGPGALSMCIRIVEPYICLPFDTAGVASGGICEEANYEALCAPSVRPTATPSSPPSTAPSVPPVAAPTSPLSTAAPSPPPINVGGDKDAADSSGGGGGGSGGVVGGGDDGDDGDDGDAAIAVLGVVMLIAAASALVARTRTRAKKTRGSMTSAPPVTANPVHALSAILTYETQTPPFPKTPQPHFTAAPGTVDDALDFLSCLEDTTDNIGMAPPEKKTIAWGGGELGMRPSELVSASRIVTPERVRVLSTTADNLDPYDADDYESAV